MDAGWDVGIPSSGSVPVGIGELEDIGSVVVRPLGSEVSENRCAQEKLSLDRKQELVSVQDRISVDRRKR